jgi:sulfur carrier protein
MKLILNGENQDLTDVRTIRDLVEHLGLGNTPVAVELNRQVVPRREHESTELKDGDQLEVVSLVGGG